MYSGAGSESHCLALWPSVDWNCIHCPHHFCRCWQLFQGRLDSCKEFELKNFSRNCKCSNISNRRYITDWDFPKMQTKFCHFLFHSRSWISITSRLAVSLIRHNIHLYGTFTFSGFGIARATARPFTRAPTARNFRIESTKPPRRTTTPDGPKKWLK